MEILKTILLAMTLTGSLAPHAQGNGLNKPAPLPAPEPLTYPWKVMECYAMVFHNDVLVGRVAGRSRPFQAGAGAIYRTQARHEAVQNAYASCLAMYGNSYHVICDPQNWGCKAIEL